MLQLVLIGWGVCVCFLTCEFAVCPHVGRGNVCALLRARVRSPALGALCPLGTFFLCVCVCSHRQAFLDEVLARLLKLESVVKALVAENKRLRLEVDALAIDVAVGKEKR